MSEMTLDILCPQCDVKGVIVQTAAHTFKCRNCTGSWPTAQKLINALWAAAGRRKKDKENNQYGVTEK
jgi:predicted transcriptional regulator